MSRLRVAALGLLVAAAALALHRAGSGALAPPPLTDPGSWAGWLEEREPVEAALALVRLAALAALWYLAVAAVVGVALRLVRADRLVAVADRLTVPALRRLLVATASVSLASAMSPALVAGRGPGPAVAAGVTVAAAAEAPAAPATTVGPATTPTTPTTTGGRTEPTLTMRLLPAQGEPTPVQTEPPPAQPEPGPRPPPPAPAGVAAGSWTVVPGECFWSIAEDVLAAAWGRAPSDAEIVPYWRVLIEANRATLADPANEDLIFPGQVFTVPPPPSRPPAR